MRGQVGQTRLRERVSGGMGLQRLKRIAQRVPAAIVGDEGHAAVTGDAPGDIARDGREGRAKFDDAACRRIGQPAGQRGECRRGAKSGDKLAIRRQADVPLTPDRAVAAELPDRKRVEKLVRDKEKRPFGQAVDLVMG